MHRIYRLQRYSLWSFAVIGSLFFGGVSSAADKAPFWLGLRSNTTIDEQVASEFSRRAGIVVLRAPRDSDAIGYSYPEIVARIKKRTQGVPVLAYALVSRHRERGRIEVYLLRGLNLGAPLASTRNRPVEQTIFLDVTDPIVRNAIVQRLIVERKRLGVDGFAIDLATRTPSSRPRPLALICEKKPSFCEVYAKSMDEIMSTLNVALGENGTLLYNGLWNFSPGMLEDQSRLLLQADAAAVEYFGMNPGQSNHKFSEDILPYLNVVPSLPKHKPLYVFGRGPWTYVNYEADYRWQRYLYASFLLGRREEDLFKYHTSFQVPAHAGRAGGLDVYADWNVDLGPAQGPYSIQGGLYQRHFANGRVVVAPDDGNGGRIFLESQYYGPEGQTIAGENSILPGEALILLNAQAKPQISATRRITAKTIKLWGWAYASLVNTPQGDRLKLQPLPAVLVGEHDLLLDYERSLIPFERLAIDVELMDSTAAVLAVAEVDDPRGKNFWVVVSIALPRTADITGGNSHAPVHFRAPTLPREREHWPQLHVEYPNSLKKGRIVINGPELMTKEGFRFKRWSHLRFIGASQISAITLSRRAGFPN